jgi:uncharacterized protein YabE (DUF348 family)/3D (Asp-Asp-Asp) domain-containing protein
MDGQGRDRALPGRLRGLAALCLLAGVLALLGAGLARSRSAIWVEIDGQRTAVRTHAATAGAVLRQAGISLFPEDLVSVGLDDELAPGETIRVRRSRPVVLSVDGRLWQVRTQAATIGQVLEEAGVAAGPGDELWLRRAGEGEDTACRAGLGPANRCGRRVAADTPLVEDGTLVLASIEPVLGRTAAGVAAHPPLLALHRATRVVLTDATHTSTLYSTAETVGRLLREENIPLFLGDEITPGVEARIRPDMAIVIRRSVPLEIVADGRTLHTRTLAESVGGVLGQEGIALLGRDTVEPAIDSPVQAQMTIRVTRVREELAVEFDAIPFQTIWVADPELELDSRKLVQAGQPGLTKRRYRIVYQDGQEVRRTLEDAWTEQVPVTKTLSYGTKIVIRTLMTPDGPIEYWRKMRAYTVSYTAASSGKSKTHPRYGYTRLGIKATKGVVAVDPTVIPLRTRIYVPGYGRAIAADTGGGVKGKLVDLCFDVGAYQSWHWWTDIYLLTPVPPRGQIRWLLPDWPKYPDRRR